MPLTLSLTFFEKGFTDFFNTTPFCSSLVAVEVVYIWCWDLIGIQRYGKNLGPINYYRVPIKDSQFDMICKVKEQDIMIN